MMISWEPPQALKKNLFLLYVSLIGLQFCLAADTLNPGQTISGNETLISAGEFFAVGFFTPRYSQNRYLGIWYYKISVFTVVWVANREYPITDSTSGVLKIGNDGNLMVLGAKNETLWSTNSSLPANTKSTAKILNSGNLVLVDGDSGQTLWQSFDYPTDTFLQGAKFGINLKTGHKTVYKSWISPVDASPGNFSYEIDIRGSPQFFISNGGSLYWRTGPWNGIRFSAVPEMVHVLMDNYTFFKDENEMFFIFSFFNKSIISRYQLTELGETQLLVWNEGNKRWVTFWSAPNDQCQVYGACGPFSSCNTSNSTFCSCLQGFIPKSSRDWRLRDWSGGCVRRRSLQCGNEDEFFHLSNMELPDTSQAIVDESLSLEQCKAKCLSTCACTAYANSNISGSGSGCLIWSGDLIDVREFPSGGQEFYLRVASSELVGGANNSQGSSKKKRRILLIALATTLPGIVVLVLGMWFVLKNKKIRGMRKDSWRKSSLYGRKQGEDEGSKKSSDLPLLEFGVIDGNKKRMDLPFLEFGVIEAATSNFCFTNKLGEGGFGSVYKGKLENGQEIAVKRLSKSSGQGIGEFENEVMLIAKLQHRNLVRLLGYCTHGEEKILIYEYMLNKSLDSILFDQSKSAILDWRRRFDIIIGIARGLLYLHEDSRLRIIHRDLKPSNILLDGDMNPKISDFGMARIFGGNQIQANTIRVVGTYGYMSPEYAMNGIFSVKSDVFSFGVLLLEIVSGKRSSTFYHFDESLSLIGYAWQLWKEGSALDLMDPSIVDSCQTSEVLRCIHIGLLCVQDAAGDRPNMSSIVFMLGNEMVNLPPFKKPSFPVGITLVEGDPSSSTAKASVNNVTITMVDAR